MMVVLGSLQSGIPVLSKLHSACATGALLADNWTLYWSSGSSDEDCDQMEMLQKVLDELLAH